MVLARLDSGELDEARSAIVSTRIADESQDESMRHGFDAGDRVEPPLVSSLVVELEERSSHELALSAESIEARDCKPHARECGAERAFDTVARGRFEEGHERARLSGVESP